MSMHDSSTDKDSESDKITNFAKKRNTMSILTTLFRKELTRVYQSIMNDECEISEEEMEEILRILSHIPRSKAYICDEVLHVSQSTFNLWLRLGLMPEGKHLKGWKEKRWYEDEVLEAARKIKSK